MKLLRRRFLLAGMVVAESLSLQSLCQAMECGPRRLLSSRVRLAFAFFVLTLNCCFGFSAFAQDAPSEGPKLADDIHETVDKVIVTVTLLSGKPYTGPMIVTHYRPDGSGPFPVVIFNHGRSTAMEKRAMPPRQRYISVARYWIRRGFAVFVPTRLGYGDSGLVPDPEYAGTNCENRNFTVPLTAILKEIDAIADFAKTISWADTKRLIVMGQSYGGFASIGASGQNRAGLIAAINFAGGGGGNPDQHPMQPCSPTRMADLYNEIGKHGKVPTLWLYAENDKFWGPDWPRKWHAAYVKAGAQNSPPFHQWALTGTN